MWQLLIQRVVLVAAPLETLTPSGWCDFAITTPYVSQSNPGTPAEVLIATTDVTL